MRYRYFFILFIIVALLIIIRTQQSQANSAANNNKGSTSSNESMPKKEEGKDKTKVKGILYRATWNKEGQYVFYPKDGGDKGNVLVDGFGLSEETRVLMEDGGIFELEKCWVELPKSRNFDEFDYRMYLKAKGITAIAKPKEGMIERKYEGETANWRVLAARVRKQIQKVFYQQLSGDKASLMMAILTGDTGMLGEDTKDEMRRSGLAHLMAVSGSHVVFVLGPFKFLTKSRFLSIRSRRIILLFPLLLFGWMTDFTPSVTRAVVMTAYGLLAEILDRESDGLNALGLAGLIQIVINPFSIFDAGFILSYGAAFSMIVLTPAVLKAFRVIGIEKPPMTLISGISVQIGLLPVMASMFNQVSFIGLLLNLIACPLATYACFAGIVLFAAGSLAIPFPLPSFIATSISFLLEQTAHLASLVPYNAATVASPKMPLVAVYYGILAFLLILRQAKKNLLLRKALCFACIIFVALCMVWGGGKAPRIEFLDVGQGDCALVCTSSGTVVLIDAGPGTTDVSALLLRKGISKIDFVVATHGHSDHIGGMQEIFLHHRVKYLLIPNSPSDSALQNLAHIAQKTGTKILVAKSAEIIPIDSKNKIQILSAGSNVSTADINNSYNGTDSGDADSAAINNSSLVFKLTTPSCNVLFTGDSQLESEQELILQNYAELNCDILKVAHHGSKSSTSAAFLGKINAEISVISVGRNSFGHPSSEVLKRLQVNSSEVYRTDKVGAVRIDLSDKSVMCKIK